jgi:hypothetical protein
MAFLSPYPGLRPFEVEEAHLFFGREEQTDELLLRLHETRFLAVVGPSGCGKSSLVRAGMIAALGAGFMVTAGARWQVAILRPESRPMHSLAQALVEKTCIGQAEVDKEIAIGFLEATLRRGPLGVVEALRDTPLTAKTNLLILVDQFEEIFRFEREGGRDEADAFVSLLLATARQREVPVYVVITMRSDFFGDCAIFEGLPEALNESQYLTPRLTREQRRDAIVGPARVFGGDVAFDLVNRLLNQMGTDPDQLPLMQHLLMRMWTWRFPPQEGAAPGLAGSDAPVDPGGTKRELTLADCDAVGGLEHALSQHADEAFAELDERQKPIAETLFRTLSERAPGNRDIRRPTPAGEVAELAGVSLDELVAVVETFRAPRRSFIVPPVPEPIGAERVLDITHESLIRQWDRLRDWAELEEKSAENYRRLAQTARLWRQGKSALWQSPDLEVALDWRAREQPTALWAKRYGSNFAPAMTFLGASSEAKEAARRSRRNFFRATVAAILAVILSLSVVATYAVIEKNAAQKKEQEANDARQRADRGTSLAINAAETLGKSTAASGSQIEAVMQNADRLLNDVVNATGSEPKILAQRASLLLSFAASSEILGDYAQQYDWIITARRILEPTCGTGANREPGCEEIIARTFQSEGDYLLDVDKPGDAIAAYQKSAELLGKVVPPGHLTSDRPALARTEASLSGAYVAAGQYDEALSAAQACRAAVAKANIEGNAARAENSLCDLAEAKALRFLGHFDNAVAKASTALSTFRDLAGAAAGNIEFVEQAARAGIELCIALWGADRKAEAIEPLRKAEETLAPVVRANPQNDRLAALRSDVLNLEDEVYHARDRNDLSALALEARVDLAATRHGESRAAYWRQIQDSSLSNLIDRYSKLERHPDARRATHEMLALEISMSGVNAGAAALYPASILRGYYGAGWEAVRISDGVEAFQDLELALDQAERHLAQLRSEGHDPEKEYSEFKWVAYVALVTEATITAEMLPPERRVEVLTKIAANATRYAQADPRIIRFRIAQEQSLYQLARAKDLAGDAVGAREAHEAASDAGLHDSTIVLVHLYHEGGAGLPSDQKRAQELEILAAKQSDAPARREEIVYQNGNRDSEILYFRDPAGDADPMADEYYRLTRYFGAHVTDAAKRDIESVYAKAKDARAPVADIINDLENAPRIAPDTTMSVVSDVVARARNKFDAKDLEGAVHIVDDAWTPLAELDQGNDRFFLLAWHQLTRIALDVEAAARVANKQVTEQQARVLAEKTTDRVLAVQADESSPRLDLSADLEDMARQENEATHWDYAIKLYRRAIELREKVRVDDPKNAECHCHVAQDYEMIGKIEQARHNSDSALLAYERAFMIYEDLARLSPAPLWDRDLAIASSDLATLFGNDREEPLSALLYAQKAASIRKTYAELQSADSATRIQYAASLERVSDYAWASAVNKRDNNPQVAGEYFELAIKSRSDANAIRGDVLAVDPGSGERRTLGANIGIMANFYFSWGRPDQARALLDNPVDAARRELSASSPGAADYDSLSYSVAIALQQREEAFAKRESKDYDAILRDVMEAASLLRPLLKLRFNTNDISPKDALVNALVSISFYSLFISHDRESLHAAQEGLVIAPDNLMLAMNGAHALMFMGRTEEARRRYIENIGKKVANATWEHEVADDFEQLKAAGRSTPLMDEVLKAFAAQPKTAAKR